MILLHPVLSVQAEAYQDWFFWQRWPRGAKRLPTTDKKGTSGTSVVFGHV